MLPPQKPGLRGALVLKAAKIFGIFPKSQSKHGSSDAFIPSKIRSCSLPQVLPPGHSWAQLCKIPAGTEWEWKQRGTKDQQHLELVLRVVLLSKILSCAVQTPENVTNICVPAQLGTVLGFWRLSGSSVNNPEVPSWWFLAAGGVYNIQYVII